MKRSLIYLAIALLLAVPVSGAPVSGDTAAGADDLLPKIAKVFAGNSVAISFTLRSGDSSLGDGTALLTSSAYKLITPITEFWCDGGSRWIVDRVAEEVIVEPVEGELSSILSSLRESYPFEASFEGRRATAVRLAPDSAADSSGAAVSAGTSGAAVSAGTSGAAVSTVQDGDLNFGDMRDLTIYSDPASGRVLGCTMNYGGAPLTFVVKSISVNHLTGAESFAFPTASLSDSYIVTDLR